MSASATDTSVSNLVAIVQELPEKMTSAAVLRALIQAEQAGYQRCLAERPLEQVRLWGDPMLALKHQAQAMDFVFDRLLGPRK